MKQKFKDLIERNRWVKGIPNSLTLCNSLCGFASILLTLESYKHPEMQSSIYAWSAAMILFAMVFDALDGFAARLLNAGSMHGLQMDSLADMVTFGVAPATLVAVMAHNMEQFSSMKDYLPICILCAVYLGCAALRLATYNVHAILEKKSSDKFSGLPSPGGAAAICVLVIYSAATDGSLNAYFKYLPVYTAILGILMVSSIPYMHFAKWIISTKRNPIRLGFLILLFILWGVSIFLKYNWLLFPATVVSIYVIWGPVSFFAVKLGVIRRQTDFVAESPDKEDRQ